MVFIKRKGNRTERNWNLEYRSSVVLVSKLNGGRRELAGLSGVLENNIALSPDGRFIIYYNPVFGQYFSYNIQLNITRNITRQIMTKWTAKNDRPETNDFALGIAGWADDGNAVLLYDRNDIWLLDLMGLRPPRCLTNRFGIRNNMIFRICNFRCLDRSNVTRVYVLSAFNIQTKRNGFYSVNLKGTNNPCKVEYG